MSVLVVNKVNWMAILRLAMACVAALLFSSFTCVRSESVGMKQKEMQVRLVFERVEGSQYFFFLQNDSTKPIFLLFENFYALRTAAECGWKHSVPRAATFFPLWDPDEQNHKLPDTEVAPGMRLEIKVASPILSSSANLLASFKGGLCRIRIQLQRPDQVVESNEFEP